MPLLSSKLGLLIAAGPDHPGFDGILNLADSALGEGSAVYLYLLHDAVEGINSPRLASLRSPQFHLAACAHAARIREVGMNAGIIWSGLGTLAGFIAGTDRFVAVGPGSGEAPGIQPSPRFSRDNAAPVCLVSISYDPRLSPHPAEAVRVAGGLAASGHVRVALFLHEQAVPLLSDSPAALEDGHLIEEHLSLLVSSGGRIACRQVIETATLKQPAETWTADELRQARSAAHARLEF